MNIHALENYRALMDGLDPEGTPKAQFVHRTAAPIANSGQKLGVLDASFNPPTIAHAALVTHAQQAFHFDEQLLLLAKANVDKDIFGADLAQRLAMMVAYASDHLSVAGCSHARFIDKAQALTRLFPHNTQIYFIVGYDTLIRIFDPRYYADMKAELETLFSLCHLISANREDHGQDALHTFMAQPHCEPFAQRVHALQLPLTFGTVSSTEVRNCLQRGAPIHDLVPPSIAQTINHLNLYTA